MHFVYEPLSVDLQKSALLQLSMDAEEARCRTAVKQAQMQQGTAAPQDAAPAAEQAIEALRSLRHERRCLSEQLNALNNPPVAGPDAPPPVRQLSVLRGGTGVLQNMGSGALQRMGSIALHREGSSALQRVNSSALQRVGSNVLQRADSVGQQMIRQSSKSLQRMGSSGGAALAILLTEGGNDARAAQLLEATRATVAASLGADAADSIFEHCGSMDAALTRVRAPLHLDFVSLHRRLHACIILPRLKYMSIQIFCYRLQSKKRPCCCPNYTQSLRALV